MHRHTLFLGQGCDQFRKRYIVLGSNLCLQHGQVFFRERKRDTAATRLGLQTFTRMVEFHIAGDTASRK